MQRQNLEHILRAASGITGTDRFIVIGSQAILGQFPNPPQEFLNSFEADLFTLRTPDDAALIDGSIGEESPFHRTFGYYAHGVGENTAVLPAGWKDRLISISTPATGGAIGLCLEVHDLAISKLIAGREKDLEFVAALFKHHFANPQTMRERLAQTPIDDVLRTICEARITRLSS